MKKPYCIVIPFGNLHNAQCILRMAHEKYGIIGWIEEIDVPKAQYNEYLKSTQILPYESDLVNALYRTKNKWLRESP